jgi:chromate transporter
VAALGLGLGWDHVYARVAVYVSQMAVLTFGGAYAVLAWVAQAAVSDFGWLTAPQMLDGLAMAETTPGPLIMVTQCVGRQGNGRLIAGAALAGAGAGALLLAVGLA